MQRGLTVQHAVVRKDQPVIQINSEGIFGVDLLREGKIFTEWERIKTIEIFESEVLLTERTFTYIKDKEKGTLTIHYYVDPLTLQARAASNLVDEKGQPMCNSKGEYISKIFLPPADKERDPRTLLCWKDFENMTLLWARQSGEFAKLKDRRFVYNKDIPEFIWHVEPRLDLEDYEGFGFDIPEEYKNSKITKFGESQNFARKEDLISELKSILEAKETGKVLMIKPNPIKTEQLINQWSSIGAGI
jgi:hypothetical protein